MIKKCDLHWLSGFLEGEGSFLKGPPCKPNMPAVSAVSTDEDVIARVAKMFKQKYHAVGKKRSKLNGWKIPYRFALRGRRAVDLMKKLFPLMGKRRQQQIIRALTCYKAKSYRLDAEIVKRIKLLCKKGMLSQSKIAKKFGLRRETVNRINTGKKWSQVLV